MLPDVATSVQSGSSRDSPHATPITGAQVMRAEGKLAVEIQTPLNLISTEIAELKLQVLELHSITGILDDRLSRLEFCETPGRAANGRMPSEDRIARLEEHVRALSALLPSSVTGGMGKPDSAAVEMQSSAANSEQNDQLLALLKSQVQDLSGKMEKLDNAVRHLSKKAAKEENTAKYLNAEARRKADEATKTTAGTRSSSGSGAPLPTLLVGGESSASSSRCVPQSSRDIRRAPAPANGIVSYGPPGHILGSQSAWHPQHGIWQPQPVLYPGFPSPLAAAGRFSLPQPW